MTVLRRPDFVGSALRDDRGTAAVEFSLLLPVFCLLLVGTIDFGGVLYVKFRLNAAVTAASNYALVNAANVSSTGATAMGNTIGAILNASSAASPTTGTTVVNNGTTTTSTGTTTSSGGTAANADSCYCPTLSGTTLSFGSAASCGSGCAGGGLAGKFVAIAAQQTYRPFFSNYGIVQNNGIASRSVVQTQ